MDDNRTVYIVVSQTGTILSRILKALTKAPYNHASLALDASLERMYSFGRLNPYNPFIGGFVMESPNRGTFKRFKNTRMALIQLQIPEQDYRQLEEALLTMYATRRRYHYNYVGLASALFHIAYCHERWYYCSEFVKDILVKNHILDEKAFRKIVKPMDFIEMNSGEIIYEGLITDYVCHLEQAPQRMIG